MKKVNRLRKRMEQNKRYFIPSLVLLTALGAGIYGVRHVDAQGNMHQASMAERIGHKFNLNQDEVQKVFAEERSARQSTKQENFEKKLAQAVAKGKLTETQKNLIMAKKAEMETQRKSMRGDQEKNWGKLREMTIAERKAEKEKRRTEMQAHREELAAWAKDNGIDEAYLLGLAEGHKNISKGFHNGKGLSDTK